jgi:hypothetical protein
MFQRFTSTLLKRNLVNDFKLNIHEVLHRLFIDGLPAFAHHHFRWISDEDATASL